MSSTIENDRFNIEPNLFNIEPNLATHIPLCDASNTSNASSSSKEIRRENSNWKKIKHAKPSPLFLQKLPIDSISDLTKSLSNKIVKKNETTAIGDTVRAMTNLPNELVNIIIGMVMPLSERITTAANRYYRTIDVKSKENGTLSNSSPLTHPNSAIITCIAEIVDTESFSNNPEQHLLLLETNPSTQSCYFPDVPARSFIATFLVVDNQNPTKCMNQLQAALKHLYLYRTGISPEDNLRHIQNVAKAYGVVT